MSVKDLLQFKERGDRSKDFLTLKKASTQPILQQQNGFQELRVDLDLDKAYEKMRELKRYYHARPAQPIYWSGTSNGTAYGILSGGA